jgi:hypothetical protein
MVMKIVRPKYPVNADLAFFEHVLLIDSMVSHSIIATPVGIKGNGSKQVLWLDTGG